MSMSSPIRVDSLDHGSGDRPTVTRPLESTQDILTLVENLTSGGTSGYEAPQTIVHE